MARNMMECTACLRRAFRAFPPAGSVANPAFTLPSTRRFATAAATTTTTTTQKTDAPRTLVEDEAAAEDPSEAEKKNKLKLETAVQKHLRHLAQDPWAVGQYVAKALERDAYDEALLLVQKASRGMHLEVSWNHLIDYQMQKQQVKRALKVYNDMKKRGQLPNVQTYTILFRGFAKSDHPKVAVAEAVKHYNVLLNDPRLTANSTHLNAVLNVCAKAGDLDNMWLIANSIDKGHRAPTAYTYSIILSSLRHSTLSEIKDLPQDQQKANIVTLLTRAKQLWQEAISWWTKGRMTLDEDLICTMGRLLLLDPTVEGKRQVFDLLEQTMNIPNLLKHPELGEEAHQDPSMRNISVPSKDRGRDRDSSSETSRGRPCPMAIPNRNTLALVMTVLATTRQTTAGVKYWNLLVRHYGIVPDLDTWLRLFGMLKVAKASEQACAILDIVPDEYTHGKPFGIALETCIRDSLNPNAMKNADAALDSMLRRLPLPDLYALRLYLRVALVNHARFRSVAQHSQLDEAKRLYGAQITEALARLWEPYKQTHYHFFKAARPRTPEDQRAVYNGKREVIALARHMVSAFDKVKNESMLPEGDLRELKPIHAKINREIQNFFTERELHEPNLPSARNSKPTKAKDDNVDADADPTIDAATATATGSGANTNTNTDTVAKAMAKEDDEFAIKHGAAWVWDTYKVAKPESAPYSWDYTSLGQVMEPSRRPERESRSNGNGRKAPSAQRRPPHNKNRGTAHRKRT